MKQVPSRVDAQRVDFKLRTHAPPLGPLLGPLRVALPLASLPLQEHQFEVDDYVFAALNIYLDVINLFLNLLELLGERR